MPIYEYRCQDCNADFEKIFSMGSAPKKTGCSCGKEATKIISSPMFALKGEGWSGKELTEKNYRKSRYKEMGKRQTAAHSENTPQLIPNVDGERCDSWEDAAMLASSKGKDTSGYKAKARKKLRA